MQKYSHLTITLIVTVIFYCFTTVVFALPSYKDHVDFDDKYISGITNKIGKEIHSKVIDTVPWRTDGLGGGSGHRELWGHTEEWFYEGKIPKDRVLEQIKKWHPEYNNSQLKKTFRELTSLSGQERMARELKSVCPSLTKKEALDISEQIFASHTIGDSTTKEWAKHLSDKRILQLAHAKQIVKRPSVHAISAQNKLARLEYFRKNGSFEGFYNTGLNYEYRAVKNLMKDYGLKCFNPGRRGYIGIQLADGTDCLFLKDEKRILTALKHHFPDKKAVVDNEVFLKIQNNPKFKPVMDRIIPKSMVVKSATRIGAIAEKALPVAGAFVSAAIENFDEIKNYSNGGIDLVGLLSKLGADAAGYRVTLYCVDAVMQKIGNDYVIAARNAGGQYLAAYFIFRAGKDYCKYLNGRIDISEFEQRMWETSKEASLSAISMIVVHVAGAGIPGGIIITPVVFFIGEQIFQRCESWYAERKWLQTMQIEDIVSFYGKENLYKFTFLSPVKHSHILLEEGEESMLNVDAHSTFLEPEKLGSILSSN